MKRITVIILKNHCNHSKGLSLIEMLITMAIMGIISLVLGQMYFQGYRIWRQNSARINVQRDTRGMLAEINKNLRQAESGAITISRNSASDPPCSKITFIGLQLGATVQMSYYQSDLKLYRSIDGTAKEIGKNIRALSFATVESGDNASVNIGLCLEEKTYAEGTKTSKLSVQIVRIMN